jgi:hypothetical protein
MDADLNAMMLADALDIVDEIGLPVVINGTTYQCSVSDAVLTQSLESGGLMDQISTLIKIPATTSNLTKRNTDFAIGKTATWESNVYRITGTSWKTGSAWIQLTVRDVNQR